VTTDSNRPIILWGATGQSKVLRECLESQDYKIAAIFDNNSDIISPFQDVPLYYGRTGLERWLQINIQKKVGFLVAIGGDRGKDRLEIQKYLTKQQLVPVIAQHSTAFVARGVTIGLGSQILAHATVCVDTVIGEGCIINTGAIVDHECKIGDGVHICPGVNMAGCIEVEHYATIGTGAVILPRIKIGMGAIIGAGAVVIKDVLPNQVVVGNPAKVIRHLD
jgi:sugar O-acyltransferase (sialic acid O-acetyltransferase NeuD family)